MKKTLCKFRQQPTSMTNMFTKLLNHLILVSLLVAGNEAGKNLNPLSPPRIGLEEDSKVINSGDTWEVNCTGK